MSDQLVDFLVRGKHLIQDIHQTPLALKILIGKSGNSITLLNWFMMIIRVFMRFTILKLIGLMRLIFFDFQFMPASAELLARGVGEVKVPRVYHLIEAVLEAMRKYRLIRAAIIRQLFHLTGSLATRVLYCYSRRTIIFGFIPKAVQV